MSLIERLDGLERRLTVEVPPEAFMPRVEEKLHNLAKRAKIKGFRPGKVPFSKIKQQFSEPVLAQVAEDIMPEYVQAAIEKESIELVGRPSVDCDTLKLNEPIKFIVTFETFPTIDLTNLKKIQIDQLDAKITPKEVNDSINRLRRQHAEWEVVDRPAQNGDRLQLDFSGSIKGEPFAGGQAKNTQVDLGFSQLIPDFEAGLIGTTANQSLDIKVKFPKDYVASELAGKKAVFAVTVHAVEQPKLPELDTEFIKQLGVEQGTLGVLREEIRKSLEHELTQATNNKVKGTVINTLLAKHKFPLPKIMVEEELQAIKSEAANRGESFDEEALRKRAEYQVAQSVLLHAVIKKYDIELDDARVRDYVSRLALSDQDQEKVFSWLQQNEGEKRRIETIVLEEQVMEKLLEEVQVNKKVVDFDTAMKPLSFTIDD